MLTSAALIRIRFEWTAKPWAVTMCLEILPIDERWTRNTLAAFGLNCPREVDLWISSHLATTTLELVASTFATAFIDSLCMDGVRVKELPLILVPFVICARLPHEGVFLGRPEAATDRERHQSATNAHEVAHGVSTSAEVVMANAATVGAPTAAEIIHFLAELTVCGCGAAAHSDLHRRWGSHDADGRRRRK